MDIINREDYIEKSVELLTPLFKVQGYELPTIKVSCSWPGGKNYKKIGGQCWPRHLSTANLNEIFISPTVDNPKRIIEILVHELIHAIDDCKHGHRKEFTKIMRAIGLEGKPTNTRASDRLYAEIELIVNELGTYPHKKLSTVPKKEKGRQLKAECDSCGAIWRMSKKWLERVVVCPVCESKNIHLG